MISDDTLTLYFYDDGLTSEEKRVVEAALGADPLLAAHYAVLCRQFQQWREPDTARCFVGFHRLRLRVDPCHGPAECFSGLPRTFERFSWRHVQLYRGEVRKGRTLLCGYVRATVRIVDSVDSIWSVAYGDGENGSRGLQALRPDCRRSRDRPWRGSLFHGSR